MVESEKKTIIGHLITGKNTDENDKKIIHNIKPPLWGKNKVG